MLALTMIVKATPDEAPYLDACLKSVHKYVDKIFLNINHKEGAEPAQEILDVVNKYKADYIVTVWRDHFADARNALEVPKDYTWILWLDTDDTIRNAKKLRDIIEIGRNRDAIYVNYEYDHDEDGNVITSHMSARLYKNNGSHQWKGRIHETLIETRAVAQGMSTEIAIVHHAREERKHESLVRNIALLEKQLEEEKEIDPRTLFYLAGSYIDAGRDEDAKTLLEQYVQLSGWDEERSQAYNQLGKIAKRADKPSEAKLHYLQAIGESPYDPEPYIELGQLEMETQNDGKAIYWLEWAINMPQRDTTLVRNPTSVSYRAQVLLAQAYANVGGENVEKALKHAKNALKVRKDPFTKRFVEAMEEAVSMKKELKGILETIRKSPKGKAKEILENIPERLKDNPAIVALKSKYLPFTWPEKSIAIFTGETAIDAWGPWSLQEGIGGSEEAIIRIAPKLKDLGYKVVVFGKPGHLAGEYDGVQWRNFWECNLDDTFDVFVSWRNPFLYDKKIIARKNYLWLHDVMEVGEFTPERLANVDRVILLSKYHRTCYPNIPDDKVFYSGNGIDPEDFEALDGKIRRNPHKIIYASSQVRGLKNLYDIWPKVKKAVPDAELHAYYGWESYDKINAGNPERMAWKEMMVNKAKELPDVTDHGKVSQTDIVRHGFESGIWAYPTEFPEIYCITAVKSQASGAVPVTADFAALDEMVQFGEKMPFNSQRDLDKYADRLIWWLKNPKAQEKERKKMMEWARTLSWANTAKGWVDSFDAD